VQPLKPCRRPGATITGAQSRFASRSSDGAPSGTSGLGPNHELDCPVPRLTLLFFGAAKDVPEAAKTVTAGTACLHPDMQAKGQTGHSFRRRYGP
jgi:hypothetical protein